MVTKLNIKKMQGYLFEIAITPYKTNRNKLWILNQNKPNIKG